MKSLFRVMVLTLVSAGILSAAAYPNNTASANTTITPQKNSSAPIPLCDPWGQKGCH